VRAATVCLLVALTFATGLAAGPRQSRVVPDIPASADTLPDPFALPDTNRPPVPSPDANGTRPAPGDTNVIPASPPRDSTGGIDTVVQYSATDSVLFFLPGRQMTLYRDATIGYQNMGLKSAEITVDWSSATLTARGVPDSTDSTGMKYAGTPVMTEGGERYDGHELSYNFRTRRGRIDLGDTKIEEGFYHGEEIKKLDGNDMFVRDGRYTTCDLPEPHYYFGSPRMKVGVQDKVVAEPVYLYIADVPVFGLPFVVLPNRAGRRSGIIAPAFGEDGRRGKFLSHLGFYWATSDYMDLAVKSDLYTKGGWALYSDYRYSLRYNFSGSLTGEYKHLFTGEEGDPGRTGDNSYRVNMTHSQQFDPTTRLGVNFTFTSNNSFVNTNNLSQGLNQNIVSNATLSRSWEGTPNSISLNVGRTQDLRNGNVTEVLPSVSFNHSQSFPFRSGGGSGSSTAWYEEIGLGYSANITNRLSATDKTLTGVKTGDGDVLGSVTARERDRNRSLSQSLNLNFAPKLGHITLTPSISYRDQRSFIENDVPLRDETDSTWAVRKQTSSSKSGVVTATLSAGTKLYGILQPGILGVSAFRHTLTPNLSFSYANPVIGEDRGKETMTARLGIGNVFEIKTITADTGKPEKIQLLNLNAGVSYNFSADSLRLSPLTLSFRTGIRNVVDIDGGASYDFYKLVETSPGSYRRINTFLVSDEGRLARLTNFRISVSTRLSGEGAGGGGAAAGPPGVVPPTGNPFAGGGGSGAEPNFSIPWSLSLSLAYSESKVLPNPTRSSTLRGSLEFNLTEKWKVSSGGGYDMIQKELVAPDVTISRDLHCWFMNFYWVPTGPYRQYRFEIRVKASQLSDLKLTKQGSDRGFAD